MDDIYFIQYDDGTFEGEHYDTLQDALKRLSSLDNQGDPCVVKYRNTHQYFDKSET